MNEFDEHEEIAALKPCVVATLEGLVVGGISAGITVSNTSDCLNYLPNNRSNAQGAIRHRLRPADRAKSLMSDSLALQERARKSMPSGQALDMTVLTLRAVV